VKKFIKENWFKLIISSAFVAVAGSVVFYLVIFLPQTEGNKIIPAKDTTSTLSTLNVTVLPTDYGLSGKGMYADKYPDNITVNTIIVTADKLGAYGLAGGVWLAPKGWTGQGLLGADGSSQIDLYQQGGSKSYGARISYSEIPACVGCMVDAAAPYFSSATLEYNKGNFGEVAPLIIPSGLVATSISPTLITYTLPNENGLSVRGVVYYNPNNNYANPFLEAKFFLPSSESDVLDFLVKNFIIQENLK